MYEQSFVLTLVYCVQTVEVQLQRDRAVIAYNCDQLEQKVVM
jgi:hypothetical protein